MTTPAGSKAKLIVGLGEVVGWPASVTMPSLGVCSTPSRKIVPPPKIAIWPEIASEMNAAYDTIANGGAEYGGVMPGFGAVLDESQRHAIVAWFQSLWTDEIYEKWRAIDERSRQ